MHTTLVQVLFLLFVLWVSPLAISQAPKGYSNQLGMKLVLVRPGTFIMGSPVLEEGRGSDEIQHEVTITKEFSIGAYEVTQAQYVAVMGYNPSVFQGLRVEYDHTELPVDHVSWEEALEFCEKLTKMERTEATGRVYRLPTEAEWEYACRAGTTTAYSFGDEKSLLSEYGWFNDNSLSRPHSVGLKVPNAWGMYDMHGNVWEWCWDYGFAYANAKVKDPSGPATGDTHVLRGGSWFRGVSDCRSAGRRGNQGRIGFNSVGFRVVLGFPIERPSLKPLENKVLGNSVNHGTQVINSIGMRMRLIPKGTFMMGSPNSEAMRGDDELQHEVTISKDYYLGVHEVTQEQYQRVMRSNPSVFQKPRIRWDTSGRPVENVTWEDAEEFCKRLSEIPDEKKAGRVYRLPTEAEWEYACRAGTNTTFSFAEKGDLLPEYAWSHRHGWFELNSSGQTHAVGLKEPNAWGLYDMHGNVWEWCSDRYGEYPEEPVVDPQGPDRGSKRVMRGGSYLLGFEDLCRSASRFGSVATYRLADIGFRISMDFDKKPVTPPEPEGR
jgi:formylglycine-generating enzyme required for sulfatase activity